MPLSRDPGPTPLFVIPVCNTPSSSRYALEPGSTGPTSLFVFKICRPPSSSRYGPDELPADSRNSQLVGSLPLSRDPGFDFDPDILLDIKTQTYGSRLRGIPGRRVGAVGQDPDISKRIRNGSSTMDYFNYFPDGKRCSSDKCIPGRRVRAVGS